MTEEKIKLSLAYVSEIKSLKAVMEICEAYQWTKHCEHNDKCNKLSLLGTDYGKPNATEIATKFAKGNREMFSKMRDIVDERIKEIQTEFDKL